MDRLDASKGPQLHDAGRVGPLRSLWRQSVRRLRAWPSAWNGRIGAVLVAGGVASVGTGAVMAWGADIGTEAALAAMHGSEAARAALAEVDAEGTSVLWRLVLEGPAIVALFAGSAFGLAALFYPGDPPAQTHDALFGGMACVAGFVGGVACVWWRAAGG